MHMDDESTPARASMDPAMSKYNIVLDKTTYELNFYIVYILVDKLYAQVADDPIDIRAFHKLRKAVHEQQPKRLTPVIYEWLVELYNKTMKNCDKSDHDECIAISGFMSELTLIRSHEGDKASEPELNKLFKMREFPKWPVAKYVSLADYYLLEKWLNDFYDTRMNVKVRAARLRRTMFELGKRFKGTEREAINWQLLKASRYQVLAMYNLQAETDKLIKAQTIPDGSSGHLSDISEKIFHELTEDMIKQGTILQANRKRENKRAKNTTVPEPRATRPKLDIPPGGLPKGGGDHQEGEAHQGV
ncbi:hypothetical protein SARC_10649 [Sphaeroforma arctica JP610]|uniref:Uncharacterized protein n=1 Tax=Sphaeroforma arctica JP610 TaxID=667725 RepID=A0A0L0FLG9_9EUKA|nr:hypothetical protein SARC_10649 [Sphaeroforma arctica JP610]KNC76873.1 hypothetical protein SARC_10649 [Sphaeroforma arctica JP610]|eukprot:XP_014150775.1 hypothetical protein SARC_10649 [Sphaeroforma arctica JP610]